MNLKYPKYYLNESGCDFIHAVQKQCGSSDGKNQAHRNTHDLHGAVAIFFFTAPWSGQKFSNARNQAFIFSTFLIFAVIAAAYAPLSHRRYGFIA